MRPAPHLADRLENTAPRSFAHQDSLTKVLESFGVKLLVRVIHRAVHLSVYLAPCSVCQLTLKVTCVVMTATALF